jgi:hypothetical protein
VNTQAEYRRHTYQPATEPAADAQPETPENHLAVGHDPSLNTTSTATGTAPRRHIAWLRPTELHTFASPLIGRGIDLHAELMRRARQGPRQANRAMRHLGQPRRSPALDSTSQEGITL